MVDASDVEISNRKLAAGLLGIFLGGLGIHKFVLGYNRAGLIMLLVSLLSCGIAAPVMSVIGLVEGILYLTRTPDEFRATYIDARREWF